MSNCPGIYHDIGKKARDVLYKDYPQQSAYNNNNKLYDCNIDMACHINEIMPGLSTAFRFDIPHQSKVDMQYMRDYAGITAGIGVAENPLLNFSGVTGTGLFSAGADMSFDIATRKFDKCNAGLSFSSATLMASLTMSGVRDGKDIPRKVIAIVRSGNFSVITESDCPTAVKRTPHHRPTAVKRTPHHRKYCVFITVIVIIRLRNDLCDTLRATCHHTVNPPTNTALAAEFTHKFSVNETVVTIGTQHALFPITLLKARVSTNGRVGALLQHQLFPSLYLSVAGAVDVTAIARSAKFGFSLAIKPN